MRSSGEEELSFPFAGLMGQEGAVGTFLRALVASLRGVRAQGVLEALLEKL